MARRAAGCRGCVALLVALLAASGASFSIDSQYGCSDRRAALAHLATVVPAATSLLLPSGPTLAASPDAGGIVCTVVLDAPELASSVGIQFVDLAINAKDVPSVEKVEPNSLAATSGVRPGMILLGRDSATKASAANVNLRIRNGPYPFIMQFATPEDYATMMASESQQPLGAEGPPDPYGGPYGRLNVRTTQNPPDCKRKAKRGDVLTIAYEARTSSSTGPMYDSTAWRRDIPVTFELGKGAVVPGVEIGLTNMCVGEVREINVPTPMGYGKFGSQVFDIPGDVRLWWRVELLELAKGSNKVEQRFK